MSQNQKSEEYIFVKERKKVVNKSFEKVVKPNQNHESATS